MREDTNILRKGMTKKAFRASMAARRCVSGFNTGTRTMKSARDYCRKSAASLMADCRKEVV